MGYQATGEGTISFIGGNHHFNKFITSIMEIKIAETFSEYEFVKGEGLRVVLQNDRNYHEDDILSALNVLSPVVESGEITFTGDDNLHWRFIFRCGKWNVERGEVVFIPEKRTFHVNYLDPQNCEDQTSFDVDGTSDFVKTFKDIISAFGVFCSDTYGDDPCWITGIEEVPYESED